MYGPGVSLMFSDDNLGQFKPIYVLLFVSIPCRVSSLSGQFMFR